MPRHDKPPPRPAGKVVRFRHRRPDFGTVVEELRDSFPKPFQEWQDALDRLRPPDLLGRIEIDLDEPESNPAPALHLVPKASAAEIERNPKAYNYLVVQLHALRNRYKYKTAWADCRDKFRTPNRDFRLIWPHARLKAKLPARARRPRGS